MAPPPPPQPSLGRSNIRKRKKTHPNESNFKSQSPQPTSHQLQLTNEDPRQSQFTQTQPIEDEKIINYINKLNPRATTTFAEKSTYLTILLTLSEPEQILQQKQKLIDNFDISDISCSNPISGSIDQYLTVYGNSSIKVAKCLLYIIYILNVKTIVNYDLFTFKTSNYKSTIIIKNNNGGIKLNTLKYLDIAHYNANVYSCFIQGDLTSIFNFVLQIVEEGRNVDSNEVENSPVFGTQIDPALYPAEYSQVMSHANKKLLNYLYSSTGKLQLQ